MATSNRLGLGMMLTGIWLACSTSNPAMIHKSAAYWMSLVTIVLGIYLLTAYGRD